MGLSATDVFLHNCQVLEYLDGMLRYVKYIE